MTKVLKTTEKMENLLGETAKFAIHAEKSGHTELAEPAKAFVLSGREVLNALYDKLTSTDGTAESALSGTEDCCKDDQVDADAGATTDDAGPEPESEPNDGNGADCTNKCICPNANTTDEDEKPRFSEAFYEVLDEMREMEVKFKNCTFNFNF